MPLTAGDLESLQADAMADDVEIDLARMSLWTEAEATVFFESGGQDAPPSDGLSCVGLPDGRRLTYREYGDPDGVPVVFMHGNGNSRLYEAMYDQTDKLTREAGARVFALDRPGVGGSSPHNEGSYSSSAEDVGAAAAALGLERFAVLGYSSGGVHALAAATLLPAGRVSALGLISSDGPYWMMRSEPSGTFDPETEKAIPRETSWEQSQAFAKREHAEMVAGYRRRATLTCIGWAKWTYASRLSFTGTTRSTRTSPRPSAPCAWPTRRRLCARSTTAWRATRCLRTALGLSSRRRSRCPASCGTAPTTRPFCRRRRATWQRSSASRSSVLRAATLDLSAQDAVLRRHKR